MRHLKKILNWAPCALVLIGCGDASEKVRERQRALDEARAALKAKKEGATTTPAESVTLEPFWDDPSYVRVSSGGPCPEGLWALFSGPVPGEGAEKEANLAKKAELSKKLRESTLLMRLRGGLGVSLQEYNPGKAQLPVLVEGSIDCTDSLGRITIAWSPARAAAREDVAMSVRSWQSQPLPFPLAIPTMAEAKEFTSKHRLDLYARVVVQLGAASVDRKMIEMSAAGDEGGSRVEDWGAGRMVRAEVRGLRLAIDREKTALVEKRGANPSEDVKPAQGRGISSVR